jgi:membrane-associated phospholipid phosphatase
MTGSGPHAPVPWPATGSGGPGRTRRGAAEELAEGVDVDRLQVFVPAIMSVGLLFSVATLIRDLLRWTGSQSRDRRTSIAAGSVLARLLDDDEPAPREIGVLNRPAYLVSALVLVAGAAYIAIGSTANFLRDGGYVRDISWLLAVSLALAVVLGFLGGVSAVLFWSWPHPPSWTMGPLRTAPLSVTPRTEGTRPSWALGPAIVLSALASGIVTLMVGSGRSIARDIDEPIANWLIEAEWIDRLALIDPFGRTRLSIALVMVIGFSAFRCRVIALTYPVAFVVTWTTTSVIRELIDRPRPVAGGDLESFPSGHMTQAVFVAGVVPLAIAVLLWSRRGEILSRALLTVAVVATGLYRIHEQHHWPLDSLAGATMGLTAVLAVHWVIQHQAWHHRCHACPWSSHPEPVHWERGVIELSPGAVRVVSRLAAGLAIAIAVVLAVAMLAVGLPTDPEGYGLGATVTRYTQMGLVGALVAAGLLALRWRATAAVLLAFIGVALGVFGSVQYPPDQTAVLTAAILVPAVLAWLAWQPTETLGRIALLAMGTTGLLGGTVAGATWVFDYYFGPTHPESAATALVDAEADWLWLGSVQADRAVVVAGGFDEDEELELRFRSGDGPETTVAALTDDDGVARFELSGLETGARVDYVVDEEGEAALADRVDATFHTPTRGPQDLVIAAGSCARSQSNGSVYDAIVGHRPDLYLAVGDLHYSNLESTDPGDHIRAWGSSLSQPAQAALFSSVPTAYVWDDHDFGPNNADRSSPSRPAVLAAYRRAVPHHGVDPDLDAPIAQAFTVGRVRFVLADTRSQRTDTEMLGAEQLEWLIEELTTSSRTHALVVWANPTPWISASGPEDWSRYAEERRTIADALAGADVDNLIMVSGDAHMVAIDDGTNSGYASDGSPGFPVLHAAALDRGGSIKGGPYSHGAFPGSGQYGLVEIDDDGGGEVGVRLSGHTWDGRELTSLELTFAVPPGATAP